MEPAMEQDAIEVATYALNEFVVEKEMANYIKKEFDKKYRCERAAAPRLETFPPLFLFAFAVLTRSPFSPPLFCRLAQPDMARRRRLELRLTCGPRDQELYLLLHWAEGHLDLQEWLERAERRRALALSRCGALYCVSCVVWIFVQKTYARMPCHASHSHTVHVKT